MRDSQRAKVYAWDAATVERNQPLTREQLDQFVRGVCADYGMPIPVIRDIGQYTAGVTRTGLSLPQPWAWDKTVVVHELAHWYCKHHATEIIGHNAPWVELYVKMLVRYCNYSEPDLYDSLDSWEIEYGRSKR